MPSDPLFINVDAGAPEYNAREYRRGLAGLLVPGPDRFGAREGLRPGHVPVSLSGTTWTVHDLTGVVYPGITSQAGPYLVQHPEESGSLDPASADDRIDALDLQIQDHDEDASGERRTRVVYVVGTPDPSPSEPALTDNALRLATVLVPADGSSPTLTVVAPWTVATGGIIPVRDASELPTSGLYDGLIAYDQDTHEVLAREDGSWVNVRHGEVRARNQANTSLNLSTTEAKLLGVNLSIPSWWGGWDVDYGFTFAVQRQTSATADRRYLSRVKHEASTITLDFRHQVGRITDSGNPPDLLTVTGSNLGRTGTGTQEIALYGELPADDDYIAVERQGWARAVRVA